MLLASPSRPDRLLVAHHSLGVPEQQVENAKTCTDVSALRNTCMGCDRVGRPVGAEVKVMEMRTKTLCEGDAGEKKNFVRSAVRRIFFSR